MLRKYQGETLRPDSPCPSRPLPHDLVMGGIPHAGSQQKAFDKIQHLFMIKTLQKAGIEGIYLNIIKAIYDKPTANTILNGEKVKAFPLSRVPTFTTTIQHSFGTFGYSIRTEKEIKGIQIGK